MWYIFFKIKVNLRNLLYIDFIKKGRGGSRKEKVKRKKGKKKGKKVNSNLGRAMDMVGVLKSGRKRKYV